MFMLVYIVTCVYYTLMFIYTAWNYQKIVNEKNMNLVSRSSASYALHLCIWCCHIKFDCLLNVTQLSVIWGVKVRSAPSGVLQSFLSWRAAVQPSSVNVLKLGVCRWHGVYLDCAQAWMKTPRPHSSVIVSLHCLNQYVQLKIMTDHSNAWHKRSI